MEERREMGVPAKRQPVVRGHETLVSLARTEDVNPGIRRAGAGVDKKPIALLDRERQVGEESLLCVVQTRPGPVDRRLRLGHHPFARVTDGGIMISAHDHRAVFDHRGDAIDDPAGIRTVSDEVAEEDVSVDVRAFGVGKQAVKASRLAWMSARRAISMAIR